QAAELQLKQKILAEQDALRQHRQEVIMTFAKIKFPRFSFTIDPKTAIQDLLPPPPRSRAHCEPLLGDDLTKVPEVMFQEPSARETDPSKAMEHIAHTLAKINHVNKNKTDAYMSALREQRPDLSGLPMTLGEACRMKQDRAALFQASLNNIRDSLSQPI